MEASKAVKTAKADARKQAKAPLAHGVGRRKAAVARVWLTKGKGGLTVNGKDVADYFDTSLTQATAKTVFAIYPAAGQYDVKVNVTGGGLCAQADALKLGMARAVVTLNEDAREVLRSYKLLTVDSRVKERKKPGQKAARRKFQFVKR